MDVTIAVCTFGTDWWVQLAERRAIPSAERFGVPVVHVHGDTLHGARNEALARVDTEWVVYLDADDTLEDGYLTAMAAAPGDLRAPAVRYVGGRAYRPGIPTVAGHKHECEADCLAYGNWLVIGTAAPVELLRGVGGWRDFPVYEDWDLWARCWQAGATIARVPDAVYRAYARHNSRNRGSTTKAKRETHQAIARANGLPVPA